MRRGTSLNGTGWPGASAAAIRFVIVSAVLPSGVLSPLVVATAMASRSAGR